MRLDAACESIFARHETFHPRYGWVKKAVDAAGKDADLFNDENAVVELGVGKNMVRSIRFWGLAFQVLTVPQTEKGRSKLAIPTVIGDTMFADDGWDPYGEFLGTQWLLHWWLLAPISRVPVWWLAFNEFTGVEFSDEQLEQFILDRAKDFKPNPAAVKKDVSCLLRMYAGGGTKRSGFDDQIDCPTRDLNILEATSERGIYRFSIGSKPTLPPAIAAFACLDFVARTDNNARIVTISRLATEAGSPGRAFKLTEPVLTELLELATRNHPEISVTSAAGVPQLTLHDDPATAGTELLHNHYEALVGSARNIDPAKICGPAGSAPAKPARQLAFQGTNR